MFLQIHSSYTLYVIARDRGVPIRSSTCTVTLSVIDVNDNPPTLVIPFNQVNLMENHPVGTDIARMMANDIDLAPKPSFSIITSNGSPHEYVTIER